MTSTIKTTNATANTSHRHENNTLIECECLICWAQYDIDHKLGLSTDPVEHARLYHGNVLDNLLAAQALLKPAVGDDTPWEYNDDAYNGMNAIENLIKTVRCALDALIAE